MATRQRAALCKLRAKLRKNRESLADQFEFKMFFIINFKTSNKKTTVFEIEHVHTIMTNDHESALQQSINNNNLSDVASLINQDIVQLHGRKWFNRRSDVIGCSNDIDLLIWPRNDIESIQCKIFSRWKDETASSFRPILNEFTLHHNCYMKQIKAYHDSHQSSGIVLTNPEENMFLFLSRHDLDPSRNQAVIYRLNSLCLYVPQTELTQWGASSLDRVMRPILDVI